MKNTLLIFFLTLFTSAASFADDFAEGYYRIVNLGLETLGTRTGVKYTTYCHVADSYLMSREDLESAGTAQDFEALQLWPTTIDNSLTTPSSVIYLKKTSTGWDLQSQGVSIEERLKIASSNITWKAEGNTNKCTLSATWKGQTLYLWASLKMKGSNHFYTTTSSKVESTNTTKSDLYKQWKLIKINNDDNYVAVKPRLKSTVDGVTKYYAPYYAAYPFKVISEGMKVYYVSDLGTDYYTLKEIESDIIPATTPVLIECTSENIADNKIEPLDGVTPQEITDNKLTGCYFCNPYAQAVSPTRLTAFDQATVRAWNIDKDGKLVLSNEQTSDYYNSTKKDYYILANESYATNLPTGTESVLYEGTSKPKIKTIAVDPTSVTIPYNTTKYVTVSVTEPEAASGKTVTATSSNTNVVTVTPEATLDANGKAQFTITPVIPTSGTATVTFSTIDYNGSTITATTQVTVPQPDIEAISVDKTTISAKYTEPHETWTVTVTASPAYASKGKTITATSSNNTVAATTEGSKVLDENGQATFTIEGKKVGTTDITYQIDGTTLKATTSVNITEHPIESLTVDKATLTIPYAGNSTITVTALPAYISKGMVIKATSSDNTIATLDKESLTLDENGQAVFTVNGKNPGNASVKFSIEGKELTATSTITVQEPPIETVTVDNASLDIIYGNKNTITVQALPAVASKGKTVTAKSSDDSIVAIENNTLQFDNTGKATFSFEGKNIGSANITFSVEGTDKTAQSAINVLKPEITSVSVDVSSMTLEIDGTREVTVTALPAISTKGATVSAQSADSNIAATSIESVTLDENGKATFTINAKNAGTTNITFSVDGTTLTANTTVTVAKPDVSQVIVSEAEVTINKDETKEIIVTALPATGSEGKTVTVKSSDPTIAMTTQDELKLDATGKATFTIEAKNIGDAVLTFTVEGFLLSATTAVHVPMPEISSISVDKPALTIEVGNSETATVTTLPAIAAANKTLQVSSSNTDVAEASSVTIDADGKASVNITAKAEGTAIITYTIEGTSLSASTTVTVPHVPSPEISSLSVDFTDATLKTYETKVVTVTALPILLSQGNTVHVSSSNPEVATANEATVGADGTASITISAKSKGTTTITYSMDGTTLTASTYVTVIEDKVAAPTADLQDGSLFYKGKTVSLINNESGSTLYYTTDGSDPKTSASRKVYSNAIALESTIDIKAVAENAKGTQSDILSVHYTLAQNSNGVALNEGWNWVSFNMENDKLKTFDTMLACGTWKEGDEVKDKSSFYDYSVTYNKWFGTLKKSNTTTGMIDGMLKIHSASNQVLNITGDAVNPESSSITAAPGWNYIAYVPIYNMDVNTALQSYQAKINDVIKSQEASAVYTGTEWKGDLTSMQAGKGYMLYHSDSTTTTSFNYPVIYPIVSSSAAKSSNLTLGDMAEESSDAVKTYIFSGNMTIISELEGNDIEEGDQVVAVSNGEITGSTHVADNKIIMTVSGDNAVSMTLYIKRSGEIIAKSTENITFHDNDIYGSWSKPATITFDEANAVMSIDADTSSAKHVYGVDGTTYGKYNEKLMNSLPNGTYIIKGSQGASKVIKR